MHHVLTQLWGYVSAISVWWWGAVGSVLMTPEVIKPFGWGRRFLERVHWRIQYSLSLALVLLFVAQFSVYRDLLTLYDRESKDWVSKETSLREEVSRRDGEMTRIERDLAYERHRAEEAEAKLADARAEKTDALATSVSAMLAELRRNNPDVKNITLLTKPGAGEQFTTVNSGDMVEGKIRGVYVKLKILEITPVSWTFMVDELHAQRGHAIINEKSSAVVVPANTPAGIASGGGCVIIATAAPVGGGKMVPWLGVVPQSERLGALIGLPISVCSGGS